MQFETEDERSRNAGLTVGQYAVQLKNCAECLILDGTPSDPDHIHIARFDRTDRAIIPLADAEALTPVAVQKIEAYMALDGNRPDN